ncbi:MAG: YbhB/YbcL family Raf kinase inhibitor-like protein [Dissulfurispiraceae bacterium]|jgi:Raf kinase inhibitor-like YbhB/YbcL family protein
MIKGLRLKAFAGIAVIIISIIFVREGATMSDFKLVSTAFQNNSLIPSKYTCDGSDINPPLAIGNVPGGTKSLTLIVDDPDAPMGTWVHWLVWNIAPDTKEIKENDAPKGAGFGLNDFKKTSYGGPCPPSGTHRYFFKLYALDTTLNLPSGSKKADIEKAMKGHILAQTEIIGLYKRK